MCGRHYGANQANRIVVDRAGGPCRDDGLRRRPVPVNETRTDPRTGKWSFVVGRLFGLHRVFGNQGIADEVNHCHRPAT